MCAGCHRDGARLRPQASILTTTAYDSIMHNRHTMILIMKLHSLLLAVEGRESSAGGPGVGVHCQLGQWPGQGPGLLKHVYHRIVE